MASYSLSHLLVFSSFLFLVIHISCSSAVATVPVPPQACKVEKGPCYDPRESLRLKIVAIVVILVTSLIGVCFPLLFRTISYLHPEGSLFAVVKAFASGVILATGYMHVLPDSFHDLNSPCLPHNPWRKFPFTTFVAMISAVLVLMMDSFMMTFNNKRKIKGRGGRSSGEILGHHNPVADREVVASTLPNGLGHSHCVLQQTSHDVEKSLTINRNRTIAQVLEMGIVVHSVVIGISLGASKNPCTIRPLVAALCFHQMFEGMGLGSCILQAEYGMGVRVIMFFFFSVTTPFGIALGIALSTVYSDNDQTALIVVGLLNASSAGLLNYMALVDLLAADFLGPKLQGSAKLQACAYLAVLLGAGGMSFMAKWA